MADLEEQPLAISDELLEVRRRRYREARAAGLSMAEARLFADSDQDVGLLRRLVAGGCDPHLIARIVAY
jgi:hypothetical protein